MSVGVSLHVPCAWRYLRLFNLNMCVFFFNSGKWSSDFFCYTNLLDPNLCLSSKLKTQSCPSFFSIHNISLDNFLISCGLKFTHILMTPKFISPA